LHNIAELENHLGISEKAMAEFIIELATGKSSIKEFQKALASNGAEMPESLVHTIWNVIQRLTQVSVCTLLQLASAQYVWSFALNLLSSLQSSKPKGTGLDSASRLSGASGLALQDSKERAKQLDAELIAEGLSRRQQSHNDASTSAANGSHSRELDSSRHKSHRSDEDGRPGHNRDSPDRDRHWDRDRKRQHRSRSRDRHGKRRRTVSPEDRDSGKDRRGPAGNRPPPAPLLDKPERGGVHRGKVSGLMDFGCFVELQGFKSRVEGLVHITNLSKTR